jgi:hypothetical protein
MTIDPLPPCFSALADAMAAYNEEKDNGFPGSLNDYLDMQSRTIAVERAEHSVEQEFQALLELNEWRRIERVCREWLARVTVSEAAE